MKKYIEEHKTGMINTQRVEAINKVHFKTDLPVVERGALYLSGEGAATALVMKRGAELFNKASEEGYSAVVIAGGRRPWLDLKALSVFPKIRAEGLPLPRLWDREAAYGVRVFADHADPEKFERYKKEDRIHIIPRGNADSQKVKACVDIFNEASLVQAVTLPYTLRRLVMTIKTECPDVAVTAQGVWPFGLTVDTWPEWDLSYALVMDEADKTGPRLDGKKPLYEDVHFEHYDVVGAGNNALRREDKMRERAREGLTTECSL